MTHEIDAAVVRDHTKKARLLLTRCGYPGSKLGEEWSDILLAMESCEGDSREDESVWRKMIEKGLIKLITNILGDERIRILLIDDALKINGPESAGYDLLGGVNTPVRH